MKFTPIHAMEAWSDYRMLRLRNGRQMTLNRDKLSEWPSSPSAPNFSAVVGYQSIELHVDEGPETEQIRLGGVAHVVEQFWKIHNIRTRISLYQARELARLIGWRSALYRNSWKKRIYRNPLQIKRSEQRYQPAFDSLSEMIVAEGNPLTTTKLGSMSIKAIGSSLGPTEARQFYEAHR